MSVNYYDYYATIDDGADLDLSIQKAYGYKEAQKSIEKVYQFVEPHLKTKQQKKDFDDILSDCITDTGIPLFNTGHTKGYDSCFLKDSQLSEMDESSEEEEILQDLSENTKEE